jgi:hypothetical protein
MLRRAGFSFRTSNPERRITRIMKTNFFSTAQIPGPDSRRKLGFRSGKKGTHTSRTIMLTELSALLTSVSDDGDRDAYASAIVNGNCLGKATASTRKLTNQRLSELYGLDPTLPIFRALRRVWSVDENSRPLLALLVALARDPLLRATAPNIISLPVGTEFQRQPIRDSLRAAVGERLNDSTLNKVVRNASSSWTQSGHLRGRTFKFRNQIKATPASIALALYLAYGAGFRGEELLTCDWMAVLDCKPGEARELLSQAKRLGIIDLKSAGDVFEVGFARLDAARRN